MIAFRVDASEELGLGHLVRCITLSDVFPEDKVLFVCKENPIVKRILKTKMVEYLPANCHLESELDILDETLASHQIRLLISDLLVYPFGYFPKVKRDNRKLITFHEFQTSDEYSDIVINYNTFDGFETFQLSEPPHCLGPSYVILNPSFRELKHKRKRIGTVRNILITMGGSDPKGITIKALNALAPISGDVEVTIHVGPAFRFKDELSRLSEKLQKNYTIRENVKVIAELMSNADIALASGGNSMYELAYLGIPSIIICQNRHQNEFASTLHKKEAIVNMGLVDCVSGSDILNTVTQLAEDIERRKKMRSISERLVDGKGLSRLTNKINRLMGGWSELPDEGQFSSSQKPFV